MYSAEMIKKQSSPYLLRWVHCCCDGMKKHDQTAADNKRINCILGWAILPGLLHSAVWFIDDWSKPRILKGEYEWYLGHTNFILRNPLHKRNGKVIFLQGHSNYGEDSEMEYTPFNIQFVKTEQNQLLTR